MNNSKTLVPPIKSQGIKTKLVPWIKSITPNDFRGTWVEPFMGTGAVAFNIAKNGAFLCDTNPHLINFYTAISASSITPQIVKAFLEEEGAKLLKDGENHYYKIRERFNATGNPLDFLFLNRAGFNGMIRFNKKGAFNIPFCRKPSRFAQAYITKIVNQVASVARLIIDKNYTFACQGYKETISNATRDDIIYCDPPYIDRHVDYYNGWNEENEIDLHHYLSKFPGRFILSTWHHNDFRRNEYINTIWSDFNIITREHFYHVGGKENNRNAIVEALVTNFEPKQTAIKKQCDIQPHLFT